LLQQVYEFREGPRRMSDGKDRGIHTAPSSSLWIISRGTDCEIASLLTCM
jgi:hypothetical protein